jgi:hypothetical protein
MDRQENQPPPVEADGGVVERSTGQDYLPFFFSAFSARLSFNVFSGFFFWSFF